MNKIDRFILAGLFVLSTAGCLPRKTIKPTTITAPPIEKKEEPYVSPFLKEVKVQPVDEEKGTWKNILSYQVDITTPSFKAKNIGGVIYGIKAGSKNPLIDKNVDERKYFIDYKDGSRRELTDIAKDGFIGEDDSSIDRIILIKNNRIVVYYDQERSIFREKRNGTEFSRPEGDIYREQYIQKNTKLGEEIYLTLKNEKDLKPIETSEIEKELQGRK